MFLGGASALHERRDARESTPAASLVLSVSLKTNAALIPVYKADGSIYAVVSEQRFERLQSAGLVARVVRSRNGHINRAILFLRPSEPKPVSASSVMGTRYSFKERLKHGPAWELKHLTGRRDEKTYTSPKTRATFVQVVADCTVT